MRKSCDLISKKVVKNDVLSKEKDEADSIFPHKNKEKNLFLMKYLMISFGV